MTRDHVIDWVRRTRPDWSIETRADDLLAVRPPRRRVTLLLRPTLLPRGGMRVDMVGVIVLGRDVRLPRRFARVHVYPYPELDPDLRIVDARDDGDAVLLQLRHTGIRQPLRVDHLRAVIRDGITRLGEQVFASPERST